MGYETVPDSESEPEQFVATGAADPDVAECLQEYRPNIAVEPMYAVAMGHGEPETLSLPSLIEPLRITDGDICLSFTNRDGDTKYIGYDADDTVFIFEMLRDGETRTRDLSPDFVRSWVNDDQITIEPHLTSETLLAEADRI